MTVCSRKNGSGSTHFFLLRSRSERGYAHQLTEVVFVASRSAQQTKSAAHETELTAGRLFSTTSERAFSTSVAGSGCVSFTFVERFFVLLNYTTVTQEK